MSIVLSAEVRASALMLRILPALSSVMVSIALFIAPNNKYEEFIF